MASKEIKKVIKTGSGYNIIEYTDGTQEKRKGARNWRNNNPGNIEYGAYAKKLGAIGSDGRFAIFPTYEAGRAAKQNLLFEGKSYKDKSISDAMNRYAPPSENDTNLYTAIVAKAAGVDPNTKLSDLTDEQRVKALDAMEKHEGFKVGEIIPLAAPAPVKPTTPSGYRTPPLPVGMSPADIRNYTAERDVRNYSGMEPGLMGATGLENPLTKDPLDDLVNKLIYQR